VYKIQRRLTAVIFTMYIRPGRDENLYNRQRPGIVGGAHERRAAVYARVVDVGPALDKKSYDLFVPVFGRDVQQVVCTWIKNLWLFATTQ
jgi:hypothetical protein